MGGVIEFFHKGQDMWRLQNGEVGCLNDGL